MSGRPTERPPPPFFIKISSLQLKREELRSPNTLNKIQVGVNSVELGSAEFWALDRSPGFSFYWAAEKLRLSASRFHVLGFSFHRGYVVVWRPSGIPFRHEAHRLEKTNFLWEYDI